MTPRTQDKAIAVIVGAHPFPHGNASANRMLGLALALQATGRASVVLNDDPRLNPAPEPVEGMASGIRYLNLTGESHNRRKRWRRRSTFGRRISATMASTVDTRRVDIVCVPSFFYTPRTRRALARAAPLATLVIDVVERHDSSQFRRRWLDPYFVRHRLTSWYASRSRDRVIVISSALARGPFRAKAPQVIPPVVEPAEFATIAARPRPLDAGTVVTYFGSPGSKDDLSGLVEAMGALPSADRNRCKVLIAGIDEATLARLPGVTKASRDAAGPAIQALGKLNRAELLDLLGRSHYTYLIRDPEAGFARFGFPTKVAESLAASCPPITNLTSDLGSYLTDRVDALICPDRSAEAIACTLRDAIELVETGQYSRMATAARELAARAFSPAVQGPSLSAWLASR